MNRELTLVKVVASGVTQDRALDVVGRWSGRLLELSADRFVVELAGSPQHVNEFLNAIDPYGKVSAIRSGALSFSDL